MRRSWCWVLLIAVAVGVPGPVAAQGSGSSDPSPSLEYRPLRPVLPEPKAPTPAPPVTIFREAIGGYGIGTGSFDKPVDVAKDASGNFYVLDAGNNRVQKFDGFSNFVLSWGAYGSRQGEFNRPAAVAVSPGGLVYVVDSGNHRVQQFSQDGSFIKSWGGLGSRGGDFKNPRDITFEDATTIWILDAGNERVQMFQFARDGEKSTQAPSFKLEFGNTFSSRGGTFTGLVSLAWSDERLGYLYLLGASCLVQQFQPDGTLVRSWPAVAPESGLCSPGRIETDNKNDYVYVLDTGNGLLERFNGDGHFLAALRGAERPFAGPLGFTVDADHDEILVADTENNIVQKFTLR